MMIYDLSPTGARFNVALPSRWRAIWRTATTSERALTWFALALWAAMIPTTLLLGLDERELRGVNVWVKPLKFMASVGLFALTSAWVIGLLAPVRRQKWPVRLAAWTIVIAGAFEIGYIGLQAALGQGSHFNVGDPLHAFMYGMMGVAAMSMTATQVLLAVQVSRHGRADIDPILRRAVVIGLWLTFLLGSGAGALLSNMQPPDGTGLPVIGWHWGAGDFRPAHFVGMHAQQLLPLASFLMVRITRAPGRAALSVVAIGYVAVWLAAMAVGAFG